jgi:anti-sigma B factor antagonist
LHGIKQPGLKLEKRLHDDIVILDLTGDLDSRSSGIAKDEIKTIIEEGVISVLINMEGVPYVDSAGLGTLVSALKTARLQAGTVYLAGLTGQVRMVIELTRLDRIFTIFDSVESGITRLSDPSFNETPN